MHLKIDELIHKSKSGDRDAFGQLVIHYSNYVFSVVFRMVNHEANAEDIAQETFLKAWLNIKTYNASKSQFTTWLYTIATRKCLDYLKKSALRNRELTMDVVPDFRDSLSCSDMENHEIGTMIRLACELLSPQQKVVFVLRDLEDLEVDEVVEITGFSEKKIKDNLYVARQKVREKLNRYLKCEV